MTGDGLAACIGERYLRVEFVEIGPVAQLVRAHA